MRFNSFEFLIFLPVVFLLYWHIFRGRRWQNLLIVVVSYVFYGWWDWRFLFLIAATSLSSFGSGLLLERYENHPRWRKLISGSNIIFNLAILGTFKYYNFFVENLEALLRATMGYQLDWVTLNVVLPVGISFYTFQALSYTIDVYRKDVPVTRNVVEFFAFISFFPQLVAGPIERAKNLLPQFQRDRRFDYVQAVDGCRQMLWGFFKKVVVADTCALAVDMVWAAPGQYSSLALAVGAVLFSIQIYGDFSGYSDIAVGCARLFGIRLMQNFRYPYFATDIADFWRRWHISLMTWLRDYVYIPLGGNRRGARRTALNTVLVFLVSGLWHGAAWTFVLWGLYHAALMIALRRRRLSKTSTSERGSMRSLPAMAGTFALVTLGWMLFRAPSVSAFGLYLTQLFTAGGLLDYHSLTLGKTALLWSLVLLSAEWLNRHRPHALTLPSRGLFGHRTARWGLYYLLLALLLFCHGQQQAFIYFQF